VDQNYRKQPLTAQTGVEEATKFICKLRFKQTGKDL